MPYMILDLDENTIEMAKRQARNAGRSLSEYFSFLIEEYDKKCS